MRRHPYRFAYARRRDGERGDSDASVAKRVAYGVGDGSAETGIAAFPEAA